MRFLTLLKEKSVPEWWNCYYDYENMKILISIAAKGDNIKVRMKEQQMIVQEHAEESLQLLQTNKQAQINQIANETNKLFFRYHFINKKVVFLFVQLKIHQLTERLKLYEKWESKVQEKMDEFLNLIFNLFYQTRLLNNMCLMHMQAYKKIHKKHIRIFQKYELDSPFFRIIRLKRSIDQLNNHSEKLAQLYHKHKEVEPRIAKKQLQQKLSIDKSSDSVYSYLFGFINGINIPLLVLPFILLQVNDVQGESLDRLNMERFNWWGIGYSTLYIWITAYSFRIFQTYRINYQLIFDIDDHTRTIYWPLALSSISTLFYLILFNIYILNVTGVNDQIISEEGEDKFFPFIYAMVIILVIAIFSIIKKPFCIIVRIIIDLLTPCWGVSFRSIWLTQQFITFVQPIALFGYLFCSTFQNDNQTCNDRRTEYSTIAEALALFFFFSRLVQTIFVSHAKGRFWRTLQMYIVVRCCLNIILVVIAMVSSYNSGAQMAWYFLAGFVVIYNYCLDFVHDWDLSDTCCQMKRYSAIIKKAGFVPFCIAYLLLRVGWVFQISPSILINLSSQFWPFVTVGIAELLRRLLWNLLRVEKEHRINCKEFRVKNDNIIKENQVKKEIEVHGLSGMEMQELSIQRSLKEKQTIDRILEYKNQLKRQITQWSQAKLQQLDQLEKKLFD